MATTIQLLARSDDYGLGLYKDGRPWRYFKDGDEIVALLRDIIDEGFNAFEYGDPLTDDERERDFG